MDLENFLDNLDIEVKEASAKTVTTYEKAMNRNQSKDEVVDVSNVVKKADFYSFIPKNTRVLGLDVSKSSTGWCIIEKDKTKRTGNIHLTGYLQKKYPQHKEVVMRYELKELLEQNFGNQEFDHIMIEDVFQGSNAKTVRLLYDINTAIDELIIEGKIKCHNFHRISNQKWKGWLYRIDSNNETKAMTDKPRIQKCLAMLGVTEEGEGFQDRLDATGLVAGYFMNEVSINKNDNVRKKLVWSDVTLRYRATKEDALDIKDDVTKISDGPIEIPLSSITRQNLEKYLLKNPDAVYVTKNTVPLGFLAETKKINPIKNGGYLAFWIKPPKRSKYIEN